VRIVRLPSVLTERIVFFCRAAARLATSDSIVLVRSHLVTEAEGDALRLR